MGQIDRRRAMSWNTRFERNKDYTAREALARYFLKSVGWGNSGNGTLPDRTRSPDVRLISGS